MTWNDERAMIERMEAAVRAFREAEVVYNRTTDAWGDTFGAVDARGAAWAEVVHVGTEIVEYEDSLEGLNDTHSYVRNAATCVGGEGE